MTKIVKLERKKNRTSQIIENNQRLDKFLRRQPKFNTYIYIYIKTRSKFKISNSKIKSTTKSQIRREKNQKFHSEIY